jgi:hypothetical protein
MKVMVLISFEKLSNKNFTKHSIKMVKNDTFLLGYFLSSKIYFTNRKTTDKPTTNTQPPFDCSPLCGVM